MRQRALFAFVLASLLCACGGDKRESYYKSLAEADKDGAITRGWIPYFLPTTSHEIHETHELSPSIEWCSFEFAAADSEKFRSFLKPVGVLPGTLTRIPNPAVSWWPEVLRGNLNLTSIRNSGLAPSIFEQPASSVENQIYLFAVDWQSGRAFFYSRPDTGQ